MQWPSFRKGEIGPKRDAERSDDPAVVGNVVSLVAGEVIWTWAVIAYVAREGRKGGRSWRSQVTGILTILFSPLSLFMDNSQRIHLGLLVIALNLLNSSSDVLTLFALIMASVFEPSCAYTWPYIVGVFSGLLGKCLWLGGLRGSLYSLRLLLFGGVFLVIPAIVCTRTSFHEYIAEMRLIWPHFVGQSTLGNHIIQFLLNTASKYSAVDALHPGTYFDLVKQNKARTLLTTLASLPPLSILLYSNLSLRPSSRSTTGPSQISPRSPTVALIPLIIALLSIPAVVFSPTKENVILPLLPLTLMMGLRGSPSRSFEGTGGGTGEGSWLVGCAMNLLNSMLLVPLSTGAIQVTICNLFVAIWHHVIGAPRPPLAMLSIRQISAFIMPFLSNQRITNISFSEELYHRIAYALIWFWGMKKLIEDAWAMGGLSGSRSRSGSGGGGSGSGSGSGSSSKRSRESRDRGTPAGRREKNGAENGESDPVVVEQTEN
ncbi:hypothetical protein I317_04370 [Kwoniella heveanensis CBS 569]|nr:hypothetical protein I317_04370 [Kwoniella heveanensis CBS 569]